MSQIIDKRSQGRTLGIINRERFLRRYRDQLKKAVDEAVRERQITDIEKGESISIPARDIREPGIYQGSGGVRTTVHPGNRDFIAGDRLQRPATGSGQSPGSQASDGNDSDEDEFVFEISSQEFMDLFFEDLALPDLVKKQLTRLPVYQSVRAGIVSDGLPTNLNLVRSMRNAIIRRKIMRAPYQKQLAACEAEREALDPNAAGDQPRLQTLNAMIETLQKKIAAVPFIDTFDLRYNHHTLRIVPATQAVMFCVMDVSGSMDEQKKDIAKRFFILLYLFLTRRYERIELVFIRHHTSAKEVDEQDFFYSRETGGTVVSSALELMQQIIHDRYPSQNWNIYGAQASDGDNWHADSPHCREILDKHLLPQVQFFAYVEILSTQHQSLWEAYSDLPETHPNFALESIDHVKAIYPVFRHLFKRQSA